jgi:hypothetical protein
MNGGLLLRLERLTVQEQKYNVVTPHLPLRRTAHVLPGFNQALRDKVRKKTKTYNSGYSLVVTHLTTNPPVRCLNRAERTGSLVFNVLWSYV